jgi:hypothetical protein
LLASLFARFRRLLRSKNCGKQGAMLAESLLWRALWPYCSRFGSASQLRTWSGRARQ